MTDEQKREMGITICYVIGHLQRGEMADAIDLYAVTRANLVMDALLAGGALAKATVSPEVADFDRVMRYGCGLIHRPEALAELVAGYNAFCRAQAAGPS